ncbi:LPS-assembly protein LptD [Helicobacter zhangjianzhongii]|uniref:LPS assembly protein LptD n=1 Tax=Helicobacter zhangjianzhongii TaxID=2974574 RepID=A0ACC6FRZ0_9HELI|nr:MULTISPECIES: LPS assembly protein LptD [unclassified Helicobacter]MDL0079875.1 LPS assembly protein LptD [Helicobacter sp. CPD2-1]MDL0082029.1 LPS assembly protein LptD [Helicobacter sp. XJK30-2]
MCKPSPKDIAKGTRYNALSTGLCAFACLQLLCITLIAQPLESTFEKVDSSTAQKTHNEAPKAQSLESTQPHQADHSLESTQATNPNLAPKPKQTTPKANTQKEGIAQYNKDNQKVFELLANSLHSEQNTIHAIGDAILINQELYVLADTIRYDIQERQVQASGDVRIYRDGNLLVRTKETHFSLDDKYGIIEPLYLQDTESGLWVSSARATTQDTFYTFKKAVLSGCAVPSPIWRMEASSGSYSDSKKIVSLWNPRVYIGDVPIFYFPYFSVSTNMSRKTGLLMPSFVTSSTEGFAFFLPYYIAPKTNWDITLTPQVRTERGIGGLIEFRALDSGLDRTYAELGYLYNFDEYMQRFNLKNQQIYGLRLYHLGNRPLQKYFKLNSELDNGIYLNLVHMNDLDYYRLRQINKRVYDTTYTSKANAFIQTQKHYLGLNFKYFLNLAKLDNTTTFQSVPNFQYHKYMDSLFFKELMYAIDYQFKNTTRQTGYGYIENGVRIPVGLQFSLFKQYLSLGIWNEFYAENLFLTKTQNSYIPSNDDTNKNGNIFSANYSISLNSDLSKSYNKFFHTIQFEALFSGPYLFYHNGLLSQATGDQAAQIRKKSIDLREQFGAAADYLNKFPIESPSGTIYFYDDIWDPSGISAYTIVNQTLDLKLSQYFLTSTGRNIVDWKIFQRLNFDELAYVLKSSHIDSSVIAKRPLENKFSFSPIAGLNFSASFFYSFYAKRMSELALATSFSRGAFSASASYFFKDKQAYDFLSNTILSQTGAQYLRANVSHDFGVFAFSASAGYDIEKNTLLDWDIGLYKNIRCFGIGLKFVNRRRPILTNDINNPFYVQQDYFVRLIFNFAPLTSTGLTTRF